MDENELVKKVRTAIKRAKTNLLSYQKKEGSFYGKVEFHMWSNAAYLLLIDYLEEKYDLKYGKKNKIIEWILQHQNDDGSWGNIMMKSEGNYRNTLLSVVALEQYADKEALKRAKSWLEKYSGNKWLDPYTQMFLSIKRDVKIFSPPPLFSCIPESLGRLLGKLHMKCPKLFHWSIYLFPSAWTRNALPPLQIVSLIKNKKKLNYFDKRIISKLKKKIIETQLANGSWFDTALPTMGAIYALCECGEDITNPKIQKAFNFLDGLVDDEGLLSRFRLKVWDTALSVMALLESGMSYKHAPINVALNYLLSARTSKNVWAFSEYNVNLPDNDDTALASLAVLKALGNDGRKYVENAITYLLKMQNDDGGWGAFDKNQSRKARGYMPPYHEDYGHELKDPSTADVTAHVLQFLGEVGYGTSDEQVEKAIKWLKDDQLDFGGWWGRWGLAYIYGTTQVLQALKAIGENMNKSYVKKAVHWLVSMQNDDGGWGEHYSSYYSPHPIKGESTAEHTSWCILALLDCGIDPFSETVISGIGYLLKLQKEDGSFPSSYAAAAIDPGKYEIYSAIFPLWALSKWYRIARGDNYENS
ncbi:MULTISPECIES: prenyltransferase/squalene oxidase repeat-containing protein [unclassified Archaeoglobus]|jgi:squalene cyclase|uniref:prenyltransferase/squalene oxidase repeat-containing protein n=1 Tax=unclassified Archaeoglobus TaxID=2643606 RepID=UPI0025BF07A7|nr:MULTISPECIES: prenyltransferase/squalene oxidase repeat-containing protein [unclassified Archaeoglobus]